jgi:anti-sigma factor RsiW
MTRDDLEFSISQYLDGTLGARERDALEERLATDGEARAVYAEYESLQGVLTTAAAAPVPGVDWDAFAARVSGAVGREKPPAQSYKIGAWLRPARLAIAASVLVAAGLAFALLGPGGGGGSDGPTAPVQPTRIVAVDKAPAGEAVAVAAAPNPEPVRVTIGPSPEAADDTIFVRYADTVVQRPSKALIVSAAPAGQDSPSTPF